MPLTVKIRSRARGVCGHHGNGGGKCPQSDTAKRYIDIHHYRTAQGAAASHKRDKVTGARSDGKERKTRARAKTR